MEYSAYFCGVRKTRFMIPAVKEIPRISVNKLISIFQKEKSDAFIPGCMIISRTADRGAESEKIHQLSHPFSLDAFVFMLCESGEFVVTTNSNDIHLKRHDLFINFPGHVIHVDVPESCKEPVTVHIAVMDLAFIHEMNLDIKPVAQKLLELRSSQMMELTEKGFSELNNLIKSITEEINNNEPDNATNDILRSLITAIFFKIGRVVDQKAAGNQGDKEVFDKNIRYFKEFMVLLGQHFRKERSVGFYADKMHLSAKYFTTLIKRASGQTAADWINNYVILEAKNLLKYSTMNIQEISYSLNFPNQSFFGKYFKHHTGMTPSEYKKRK